MATAKKTAKKAPAKKVAAKTPDRPARRPEVKNSYGEYDAYYLNQSNKRKMPKRSRVSVSQTPRKHSTLAGITESVQAFAKKHGVAASQVRLSVNRWDQGITASAARDETDEEFGRRVKEVERFNKALDAYRADRSAQHAWDAQRERELNEERKQREADLKARAEAAAYKDLAKQVRDKISQDAALMARLANEALSDEKFVATLRSRFTIQ